MKQRNTTIIIMDSVRKDYFERNMTQTQQIPHTKYTNVKATSSWTLPSIASILTGKSPSEHNLNCKTVFVDDTVKEMPSIKTIASEIKDKQTMIITANPYTCEYFGFNDFDYVLNISRLEKLTLIERIQLKYLTRHTQARFAFKKYWQNKEENAFALIHLMETHFPYYTRGEKRYKQTSKLINQAKEQVGLLGDGEVQVKKAYEESIQYLDRILAQQIKKMLQQNTTIYLCADHGEELFEENRWFGHEQRIKKNLIDMPLLKFESGREINETDERLMTLKQLYNMVLENGKTEKEVITEVYNQFTSRNMKIVKKRYKARGYIGTKRLLDSPAYQKYDHRNGKWEIQETNDNLEKLKRGLENE